MQLIVEYDSLVEQIVFLLQGCMPQHVQSACGTWIYCLMRDVNDMGQQMGYHSLEWNRLKEAMDTT